MRGRDAVFSFLLAGVSLPHGAFDTIADSPYSLGIKPAFHFPAFGGDASVGFYFGRDNFANPFPDGDLHLTHFSPEFEFAPTRRLCPTPSVHVGAGSQRERQITHSVSMWALVCPLYQQPSQFAVALRLSFSQQLFTPLLDSAGWVALPFEVRNSIKELE